MGYPELMITVQNDRSVKAERQHDKAEAKGQMDRDDLRLAMIGIFQDWLNQNKISTTEELELLGRLLYRVLFTGVDGKVDLFFKRVLSEVPEGERLRVQLRFDEEVADLASLPWEFLFDTDMKDFFATRVDLVLSRYVPSGAGRESLGPEKGPLRILIVVSRPENLKPVAADEVIDTIKNLAEKNPGRIKIDILDKPTILNFLEKLEDKDNKPHVLHFIGHGQYNKAKRKGEIALLNPDGKDAYWCEDKDFAKFFIRTGTIPRLVFLHLCEGAVVEKAELIANFAGIAPQLILTKIQAVVAMQYPITNAAAQTFCRAFYGELAKGATVDQAVQEGRYRITFFDPRARGTRVFGTPVLYMHSYDGIIMPTEEATSKEGADQSKGSGDVSKQAAYSEERKPEQGKQQPDLSTDKKVTEEGGSSMLRVRTVVEAGGKKLKEINLDREQMEEMYKKIYISILNELVGKKPDEMKEILIRYWTAESNPQLKSVIWEMIDAIGKIA